MKKILNWYAARYIIAIIFVISIEAIRRLPNKSGAFYLLLALASWTLIILSIYVIRIYPKRIIKTVNEIKNRRWKE